MIIKPAIGFLRTVSDARLVTDAETIVTSMTKNPCYPTPSPSLAAVTAGINDFSVALANAADGGTGLTAIKNAKRAALEALLRQLASYVSIACKGSLPDLISSGFPTQKPVPTPVGVLPAPLAPVLSTGPRTGDLRAVTKPVPNAASYNWRVALASTPAEYVQQVQKTAARITFSGLTPGERYLVDVNAVGSAGPGDWSDTAVAFVV
jgi:hypothetical protein